MQVDPLKVSDSLSGINIRLPINAYDPRVNGLKDGDLFSWATAKYDSWMKMGDPRTDPWPLVASPVPTIMISMAYVMLVTWMPRVLRGRSFPVKYPVILYNFFLVLLNAYIVVELLLTTSHYRWTCQPVDYSMDVGALRTANAIWLVYISKFVEMLDALFFIAKGNYRQLSFLHVYHHSTIFPLWWLGVKYVPGGNAVPGAILNSFIHVIMYSYYLLSSFGPRFKRYLWWKKYLTGIQLTQFAACLLQACMAYQDGCPWPEWMYWWFIGYQASFLVLFGNFYIVNYVKGKDRTASPLPNGQNKTGLKYGIENGKKVN